MRKHTSDIEDDENTEAANMPRLENQSDKHMGKDDDVSDDEPAPKPKAKTAANPMSYAFDWISAEIALE